MRSLSAQEDHPGKMTQASVCLCVCVFVCIQHLNCTLIRLCSTHIFRTFAVNINACLHLHGLLGAVCLLVLACECAWLIL